MDAKRRRIVDNLWVGGRKAELRYSHFPACSIPVVHLKKPDPPKYLGNGRLRIGDETYLLEANHEEMLEVLLDGHGAASKGQLEKVDEKVARVLQGLRQLHPAIEAHIVLPGRKGKGGYRTTIVDARPD